MQQLIIFEGILSGDDIAAVEAWLVAVPEPGAAMLAMLGALGLLRRRR
jgi:MYXO-CTERM domain-containing protein